MPDIDNLSIQIKTSADSADKALNKLVGTIGKISASLGGVNFNNFSVGIKNLSSAMQGLQNVKMPDYNRLAKGIQSIGNINSTQIQSAGVAIKELSGSLKFLDSINVSDNSKQIAELAKGISQLGYKSSTKAIDNIPKLAVAMKDLMATLSTAPRVSQNIIDMTNALAKLSRTGASSGRASTALGKSLNAYSVSATRATKHTWSLASAFGKLYASYWLIFRAFGKIGDAIDISSQLTEVQNVVDVTFGKMSSAVEDFTKNSIEQYGLSELSAKNFASTFQAMGSAMNIDKGSIASANAYLNDVTNGYIGMSDSMADVSLNLTRLTADMASFYNLEQKDVAEDLQAIFTGMTRPLRQYGIDLTQATLKEWALSQGMNANIESMTQAEKVMLRYQYVLAHTTASQGDFARTADTWANQIRILKQNFEQLGAVVGGTFINMLKPLVKALNNVMSHIIAFAETVSNALGKIFGWKYEVGGGGVTNDLETGAGAADDIADGLGTAKDNAKKLKDYVLGIDELNIISPDTDTSASGGSGSGGLGGASGDGGQWVKDKSMLEEYMSEIDTLYELGNYIRDALIGAMENIDWDAVYEKSRGFGKGLAEFLNGLLAYDGEGRTLFGEVGKTLANTLNAIVYSAQSFAKEFDFYQFGVNLADGINQFFKNFDFVALADTLNEWVDGLKETIRGFLETLTWKDIIGGITDFWGTLELDTVTFLIGAFYLKNSISNLKKLFTDAIVAKFAFSTNPINIPSLLLSFGKVALSTNPTMLADLSLRIDKMLEGSALDPNTWDWYNDLSTFTNGFTQALLDAIEQVFKNTFNWDATKGLFESAKEHLSEAFNAEFVEGEGIFANDIGKNIILGIGEGLLSAVGLIVEPIGDFFVGMWDAFCETFGIHSPAEEMKPIGEYIFLGIIEGFSSKFEEFTTKMTEFWEEYILPWFTLEKWYELFTGISEALSLKWEEIKEWWNESAIVVWWEEDVAPWFTIEKWTELFDSIKTSLTTKWTETTTLWKTNIQKWWNENVQPWFTKERWLKLGENLKNGIYEGFKGLANKVVDVLNNVISSLESLINNAISGLNSLMSRLNESPLGEALGFDFNIGNVSFGRIPHFFGGGFTSASLFWAGENNIPEMVGTVGGRTAVASGVEITGIADAVYSTGQTEASLLSAAVELLQTIADKDTTIELDGRDLVSAIDNRRLRNGYAF